jgi:hypothetical protein
MRNSRFVFATTSIYRSANLKRICAADALIFIKVWRCHLQCRQATRRSMLKITAGTADAVIPADFLRYSCTPAGYENGNGLGIVRARMAEKDA